MRLISVVMGEDTIDNRSSETMALLDYGFNMYKLNNIISKDNVIDNKNVYLGIDENVNVVATKDINILNNKQVIDRNITYEISINKIYAPVKIGDVVGKIYLYEDNNYMMSVDLTVDKDINKVNIFIYILRNLRNLIFIKI